MWESLLENLGTFWNQPGVAPLGIALVSLIAAIVIERSVLQLGKNIVGRTKTDFDDMVLETLRVPILLSVIAVGFAMAARKAGLSATMLHISDGLLKTLAIVVWWRAVTHIGSTGLRALAGRSKKFSLFQPRTVPFFDILLKIAAVLMAVYLFLVTWRINASGWLASAGVVGLVLGLAAKDTLSNLFAGIAILADAPYKLGDIIVLDAETRGKVTDIGFRSTRLLTLDGLEVTVPNSAIGSATIVNESGGPSEKRRISVEVEVAYGSDLEQVVPTLLACAEELEEVSAIPAPTVHFTTFGASGLVMKLRFWVHDPFKRDKALHLMNSRVYKALNDAGIEIPYSKQDLYIKELPQSA